jgi:ferric-dicitrate binding protein FerR (iron transport regulator)
VQQIVAPVLTKAQKARQAAMAWRASHPEEHEESLREYRRQWRKNNPDYFKKWQVDNRDYVAEMKRRYRARMALTLAIRNGCLHRALICAPIKSGRRKRYATAEPKPTQPTETKPEA